MFREFVGNYLLDCFSWFFWSGFALCSTFCPPCNAFLLAKMVPDRILSVNASIDTIGEILLKIIPTLEEVSYQVNYLIINVYLNRGAARND